MNIVIIIINYIFIDQWAEQQIGNHNYKRQTLRSKRNLREQPR